MKVYTRTGDDGSTGLGDGARVSKASRRVAAYGAVDELNALVGVLRTKPLPAPAEGELARVQPLLFEVGAFLAEPGGRFGLSPDVLRPTWLERWIDGMEGELAPLRNFVLPSGCPSAALAHVARTVCRRAEREVVALRDGGEDVGAVIPLLNRLSDAFFVLARWLNNRAGVADTPWRGHT